jgi:hypothetical protein
MHAQLESLRERLKKGKIQRVALVDDAYDCPKGVDEESWRRTRVNPFEIDLEGDPDAVEWLDALIQVDGLRSILANSLELEVEVFGRAEAQNDLTGYQADIWFFDLYWGKDPSAPDADEAAKNAAQLAREVLDQYKAEDQELPIVVLMSSRGALLNQVAGLFAREAEIPFGCFEILPKPNFVDGGGDEVIEGFFRKFYGWLSNPELRRKSFHFVRSVRRAVGHAKDKFVEVLQEMAVNDYAYILKEGIKDDGHPLGDYLLWLMEPLFVHKLHENDEVQKARLALDGISSVDGYLPLAPSRHFEEIYQCRVWKKAHKLMDAEVQVHAQLKNKSKGRNEPLDNAKAQSLRMTRLYQGDLLWSRIKPNEAWLVISPSCDLAFRVDKEGSCPVVTDPLVSVYLLPGKIYIGEAGARWKGKQRATRFFRDDEGPALIVWEPTRVQALRYCDVLSYTTKEQLERGWCLRRKYVLALIHAWSSHVTRVGLPKEPLAPRQASISLHVRDGQNWRCRRVWSRGAWYEGGEGDEIRAWLDETVAVACANELNEDWAEKLGIKSRAREEIRDLARDRFLVSMEGEFLRKGGSDQVKGVFGRRLPIKESGKRVIIYLAVYEENESDRESEEEGTE